MKKTIITNKILDRHGACLSWEEKFDEWFPSGAEPFNKIEIDKFTKQISKLAKENKEFMDSRNITNKNMLYYYSLYNILFYSGYRNEASLMYVISGKPGFYIKKISKLSIIKIKNYYLNVIKEKLY